jgi:Protein of unknown function (DUF2442).
MSAVFFQSVSTLPNYRLEVLMGSGAVIHFDFHSRLKTVRFRPLRDISLFQNVRTDGDCLYFGSGEDNVIKITASEFMDLLMVDRTR